MLVFKVLRSTAVILTALNLSLALFISPFVKGQQTINSFGPLNITRVDGENNVYIPCPFSGQYNPLWSIDQVYYEANCLPSGMIAASHGLLLPRITNEMNGTTFQCFNSDVHGGIQDSSIGTLMVERVPPEFQEDFQSDFPQYDNTIPRIDLDHQHTIFNQNNKTFALKGGFSSISCRHYQMSITMCDGMTLEQLQWPWKAESTITIPTKDLIHGNNSEPLLFYLEAFGEGEILCAAAAQYFEVEMSDVTRVTKVAHDGLCFNIYSESIPYVVLPYNHTENVYQPDCYCPIIINSLQGSEYDISKCSCIRETMFSNSLYVSRVWGIPPTYEFCFTNLSIEMNESVFHFFESLRFCTNKYGRSVDINFRRYHTSFKILVVLANPPNITYVNSDTGQIDFVSTGNGQIPLDYYTVLVRDVSGQIVFKNNYLNTTTTANIAESIQNSICSPKTLSVQAHNSFGFSESNSTIGNDTKDSMICRCIKSNVNIALELLNKDGVQVNCSQLYQSGVNLTINANKRQNVSVVCDNSTQTIIFDQLSLDCGKSHKLEAYYISSILEESIDCTLNSVVRELPCEDKDLYIIIIMTLGATLGCTIIILLLFLTITLFKICIRRRNKYFNSFAINNPEY